MISPSDIVQTYRYIEEDIYKTPLIFSSKLSQISKAKVYLKMENLQHTGSFKIRGVLAKVNSLHQSEFDKTFVAASTGNHAAAFGYASAKFKFKGVLFLPEKTSKAKVKALEAYHVEKIFYGTNSMETEAKATAYAKEINGVLIHPYNDVEIIKGQGTVALEIKDQLPEVNTVLVPIGGGGLISGIASYFKDDHVDVVGCQPANAAEMCHSVRKGYIVPPSTLDTISDASAGGIEDHALTYDICKTLLSGFELVEEEEIKKAVAFVAIHHHTLIEPTSALPVAALLNAEKYAGKTIVLVLTGKRINIDLLTEILNQYGNSY